MKLKEQFTNLDSEFDDVSIFYHNDEECEKVADKFAIEFARYITNHPKIFNNGCSMEQALSLFKIEHNF